MEPSASFLGRDRTEAQLRLLSPPPLPRPLVITPAHDNPYRPPLRRGAGRRPRGARHLHDGRGSGSRGLVAILEALPAAGADIIELGMPFTDPMADGPAIQAAGLRALNVGMTLRRRCRWCAIPRRGSGHAAHPDGLLQPHLHLWRRDVLGGRENGGRRRPHHCRLSARGRRRDLHAGARRRAGLYSLAAPTTARRVCRRSSATPRASSITFRSRESPAPPRPISASGRSVWRASSETRSCQSRSVSG